MAAFTAEELTELRRIMARQFPEQHWTKAQFNAAVQAVEDRIRAPATLTTLRNDIETAAPGEFSDAEKNKIIGVWCWTAAKRLGII